MLLQSRPKEDPPFDDMQVDVDGHRATGTRDEPNGSQSQSEAESHAESENQGDESPSQQITTAELGPRLGSDGWLTAEELEAADPRAGHYKEDIVDWIELERVCTSLREGMPCEIEEDMYTSGESSLVAKVTFHDGVSWVARLLCRSPSRRAYYFCGRNEFIMSEFATLQFLKSRTSIPVPEVYGYDKDDDNPVGAPYILVEYIHGTAALNMDDTPNSWKDSEGFEFCESSKHENFKKQLAAIQTELATIRFDHIGCIYEEVLEPSGYSIGMDPRTNAGPWKTTPEFFNDMAKSAMADIDQDENIDLDDVERIDEDGSSALPYVSQAVMLKYSDRSLFEGPFGLAHRRLGAHHVLVNEKFEILAVLGIRYVMAAPVEIQAQFPMNMGLDYKFPTDVSCMHRDRVSEPNNVTRRYTKMIRECEKTIGSDIPENGRPAFWMTSAGSLAYLAIQWYDTHEPDVIQEWTGYALRLLSSNSYPFYR